ncbi:MAG: NAD-dependent epimerase/dehydratase family protein [Pseudorhodobacter sp.]
MASEAVPFLILGATGQIGRALHAGWPWFMRGGLRPIWQTRRKQPGYLHWDILNGACPEMAASGVVLCLAGGRAAGEANRDLALAALKAAGAQGARHVFLMSSAAVYGPAAAPLTEEMQPAPLAEYGRQKLAMEQDALAHVAQSGQRMTILRLGNVAGMDALLGGAARHHPVTLDPVPGAEGGPLRSYIGPKTLGAVLARLAHLAAEHADLPPILNIATPRPVRMADLLDAAGVSWHYGPENPDVLAKVVLDTARLQRLIPLPPPAGNPASMVAEWHGVGA